MGIILGRSAQQKVAGTTADHSLLFSVTREDPLWLYHGNAKLEGFLILNSGTGDYATCRARATRCCSGSGTDKVGSVDLNLVAPFGTHLSKSCLGVLEHDIVFDRSETDGDTRSVGHGVRTDAEEI